MTNLQGCLNYAVTEAQCNDVNFDWGFNRDLYAARGIRWIKKATNATECDAYGKICTGEFPTVLLIH